MSNTGGKARRKRSPTRPDPLDAAGRGVLGLAETARQVKQGPRLHADMPGPVTLTLGPVALGTAARLAAALLELRHAQEEARAAQDRQLVFEAGIAAGTLAESDARVRAARARIAAAREKVATLKDDIRRSRILGGLCPADSAIAERALRRLGLSDDTRLVPFGVRPPAGARIRPAAVPSTQESPGPRPLSGTELVDAMMAKLSESVNHQT